MIPNRQIYWNIEGHVILYPLFLIAFIIFLWGFYRHYRLWKTGLPENRCDRPGERLKSVLSYGFGHARILRDTYPGLMHFFIFWGFAILFIGTIIVAFEADLGFHTLWGTFYLYFSLVLDILGLIGLVGLLMACYRRYVQKPARLDSKPDDAYTLILLLLIFVTGYLLEGLRIAATGDPWASWQPVGVALAAIFTAMGPGLQQGAHVVLWWVHLLLAMTFIAYLPYSKLFHILLIPANMYLRDLSGGNALKPVDFEDESKETFGVNSIREYTWKQLFDLDACIRCGRCQDNCPAYLSEKPLSPKQVTQDLKAHWQSEAPRLLAARPAAAGEDGAEVAAAEEAPALIGGVLTEDTIWSCTTCRSCEEQCPTFVEHVGRLVDLRRYLVLTESSFPSELQQAFRNMENNGNPWGVGWTKRADWTEGLEVPTLAEAGQVEVLYWPGCAGAFDDRSRKVSTALVKLFRAAGVNFAILGTEEKCCGDSARRLGNEYLFQSLVQENIETMNGHGVKKIATQCPHCFNTLLNEYPQFGGNYEVVHHSQFLLELLQQGRLQVKEDLAATVTYHDSCYLGRYNHIYQAPRQILRSVRGIQVAEMERREEKSFCCGAGGGRMWMEEKLGRSINVMRTEQALAMQPDVIATACPFCLTMLGDGLKSKDEERVQALDLAEVLIKVI